jgi:hypothetical protein
MTDKDIHSPQFNSLNLKCIEHAKYLDICKILSQPSLTQEITKKNYGSSIIHKDNHFAILDEKLKN